MNVNSVSFGASLLGQARKACRFAGMIARPSLARKLGTLVTDGYLAESGWVRSVRRPEGSIDTERPYPWATYPYIAFIEPRLRAEMRVFEYGAGSSTLFYAKRVQRVWAVEHDAAYASVLAPYLPLNAQVLLEPAHSDAYRRAIELHGVGFEIVIVDGRDRVECVATAIAHLSESGVLVLDDAERPAYLNAALTLSRAGFRRLDFWGLAPGVVGTKSTAVFYRTNNCLGL